MTAAALLTELRNSGASVTASGNIVRIEARKGVVTYELQRAVVEHKAELLVMLAEKDEPAAVRIVNTMVGDLWLVPDADALAEHPDISSSGLPVFFFQEIERLRCKTTEELRSIAMIKATFPTGRVLQ